MSKLSDLLKKAREHKGSTLREVEEATGVSNAYLSQIEKGKVNRPSPEKLKKLSSFYSINIETVMDSAGYSSLDDNFVGHNQSEIVNFLLSQKISDEEATALVSFLKTYRELRSSSLD